MIVFPTDENTKIYLETLLVLGKYFGFFPTFSKKFKWKSWKTIFSILVILYFIFLCVSSIWWTVLFVHYDNLFHAFSLLFTYTTVAINLILLLHLATKWPSIMNEWSNFDKYMNRIYGYPKFIDKFILCITLYSFINALVQYIFLHLIYLSQLWRQLDMVTVDFYLRRHFFTIFWIIPYHTTLAVFLIILHLNLYLVPTFIDTLLTVICLILVVRCKQIAKSLKDKTQSKVKNGNFIFWKTFRMAYFQLSDLVFHLDDDISLIVVCSYGLNFIHLLRFLTNFLKGFHTTTLENVYYFHSAFFVISRIIALTYFASQMNEETQKPVVLLTSLSLNNNYYKDEISRFILQISFDEVVFTGCSMFKLNKRLFLSIIDAVVTYEMMIIQYLAPKM